MLNISNITDERSYLLAAIVESSEDAILSMDMSGVVTSWNSRAEKMFGYRSNEIIGKSIHFIYPVDKVNELDEITTKVKKNERIEHFETERKRKDGNLIDVSLSISPIKNEKGDIIGIAKIIRDISGQKRASQYARSLIEASLDPLVTISPEGKITDVNDATVKVTGVQREKLIGSDFSDYFTEPEEARAGYERVFKKGFVTDYPLSIRHSSGNTTDVLYNASVYKDDKGKVLGVFAAARNATRVKQKDEFSAMITHELKTPLGPIIGYCKMLTTSMLGVMNEDQTRAINIITNNVTRLETLINDIMDARKLEIDKMKFQFEDLSLNEFFDNLNVSYMQVLHDKGIQFAVKLFSRGIVIKTDELRLRQVLDNIIGNSIKFVKSDGVIEVGCEKDDQSIVIYVKDNGIGIPPEKQKGLFKKYYQVDTSDRRPAGGSGLGLVISKGIMEKLGGSISLESDGKTGTVVYLKLRGGA